ncbi:hypothetical protein M199_gp148 [Halogranum tailed virus 1]|uniref:Uncharacterized protein n=1 Tax=Halogranum tailed virus 1 TaxID=1273749 RepID=R4TMV1_9CAUD|nr:hypothetical protein M199_gp148 [Halogranum tailed virus 1]AGM11518.1 hypothetical protein HGTV1_221 [Halogranum tailed virus 1]
MSDRRFTEVVQNGGATGHGEKERGYRAICTDCGSNHVCRRKEFGEEREAFRSEFFYVPHDIDMDAFKYVARMRAWNCCNEGDTPLDGFPECPEPVKTFIKR